MAKVVSSAAGNQPATMVLASADGMLRVEFRWRHDRYEHFFLADNCCDRTTTSIRDRDNRPVLGQSVEGDADHDWPQSPPIQQLSAETVAGKNVLLGVGAAGRSHWSISVETPTSHNSSALKFDLACRGKAIPTELGSTYQLDPRLVIEPLDLAILEEQGAGIAIRPLPSDSTYRWSYLVRRRADAAATT